MLSGGAKDGLNARLLSASRIPAESLSNLELAILAACSSGRAPSQNRYPSSDLARAFLLAGVPRVVATGWDVDSTFANELVRSLYARIRDGRSPQEALFEAQSELRARTSFSHPYYWAAFDFYQR